MDYSNDLQVSSSVRQPLDSARVAVGATRRVKTALLATLTVFSLFVGAQTVYDPTLFSFEEFNRLRQTPPLEHLRIFKSIVNARTSDLLKNLHFRDWTNLEKNLERYHKVLAYVLEDIDICAAKPKNRGRVEVVNLEVALRASRDRMNGIVRSSPSTISESVLLVIKRLDIGISVLDKFRNPEAKP